MEETATTSSVTPAPFDRGVLNQLIADSIRSIVGPQVAATVGTKAQPLSTAEIQAAAESLKQISKLVECQCDLTLAAEVSLAVEFEGFDVATFRKLLMLKLGITKDKMTEIFQWNSLLDGNLTKGTAEVYYSHFITAAVVIVLQRGTNLHVGSKNYAKTSPKGQEIVRNVISKLGIRDVRGPGKYDITWARIVASHCDVAMLVMAQGLGRIIGQKPETLPMFYCFPGAGSVVPQSLVDDYLIYSISFDRVIKRTKREYTQVGRIKQFITSSRSSRWGTSKDQPGKTGGYVSTQEKWSAHVLQCTEFAKSVSADKIPLMSTETYAALSAETKAL